MTTRTSLIDQLPATVWLVAGRSAGLVAAFAASLVIVRLFGPADFGTYRQLFLVYGTLYTIAQLGMAETLYYFVPQDEARVGRFVWNAVVTLGAAGGLCFLLLTVLSKALAAALSNPALTTPLPLLGLFLALMLASAPFEIVLVARRQLKAATAVYALSDVGKALAIVVPALMVGTLESVLWGVTGFAVTRTAVMLWWLRRTLWTAGSSAPAGWRAQFAYTLPFALAVGLDAAQANVHQYVVAARFDPATFAIYAVGVLQIPLVDVIVTSTANVMMVRLSKPGFDRRGPAALAIWHDTVHRLALVIFPLAAFLTAAARDVILLLYTPTYLASVSIFMWWAATIVFLVPCADAMLRVHAQTRFLFWLNVWRLAAVIALTGWFLTRFGLIGAVLVVLVATVVARAAALVRIAQVMGISARRALPWSRLSVTAAHAVAAAIPVYWLSLAAPLPRAALLATGAAIYVVIYTGLLLWRTQPARTTAVTTLGDVA
jgi:O-antigen/teichoic acid export membrane protein